MMYKRFSVSNFDIRIFTGLLVALHGLLKIIFISDFADYVVSALDFMSLPDTFLVITGSFFPFLEFFSGLLLVGNMRPKQSLVLVSIIMMTLFLLALFSKLYADLLFETTVFVLLGLMYLKERKGWSSGFSER